MPLITALWKWRQEKHLVLLYSRLKASLSHIRPGLKKKKKKKLCKLKN